jgi:hypothetical protein
MHTEAEERTLADSTAVLNGIVALLAAAGLSDKQIAAVTGCDPQQVRLLIDDAADPPAREWSVIDRARMTLEVRSER